MKKNYRLKGTRVLRGFTQWELADKVGIAEIEISRFETGRAAPSLEHQRRIAQVLNKEVGELFHEL